MKIATKALASILLITLLSLSAVNLVGATQSSEVGHTNERKLERIISRHDRKMELRASVLGMSVDELKEQRKTKSFASIIKSHGFKDQAAFRTALTGKLKEELKKRGWNDDKINEMVQKRLERER